MEHNAPLITTIAAGFGLALILGFAAERMVRVPGTLEAQASGIVIPLLQVQRASSAWCA